MSSGIGSIVDRLRARLARARAARRLGRLRALGMTVGEGTALAPTTWVDWSHCYLICIGNRCRIEDGVLILAHDAQMDEFLDAGRLGRVVIHDHSVIGARTVILPGIEIGPRTIVTPHSVVTRSCPPDTVCSGNPARPIASLDAFLQGHRETMAHARTLSSEEYRRLTSTWQGRAAFLESLGEAGAYVFDGAGGPPPGH